MATLESITLSFFHLSNHPNPPSPTPSRFKLSTPSYTPKISLKSFPISTNFQPCFSSAIQEQVSIDGEEEEKLDETQKEIQKRKLFVLNLPWAFSVADLKALFGECGTVADVEIIKWKNGKSRGFAFVTMSSGEEAMTVIKKFDSHEILGRVIRVEFAKKFKKPSPPAPEGQLRPNETRHKLYVSNLAWKVRSSNLREFFSADFNPVSTRVVFESPSGRSAGYGFVSFASKEEAESAKSALDGKELFGRSVILKYSERVTDKTETKEENLGKEQQSAES